MFNIRNVKKQIWKLFFLFYKIYQLYYINKVSRKKSITVVFFAANVSLWRYQHLYELLSHHKRFKVYIVLSSFIVNPEAEREKSIQLLKEYFDARRMQYVDNTNKYYNNIKEWINPDILFYPQFYVKNLIPEHDALNFKSKLICAYPYGFKESQAPWAYNNLFHNYAWKLFYPINDDLINAQHYAYNKGRNVVITGYPNADDFLSSDVADVWKSQKKKKKRIIWAPHFTIDGSLSPLNLSCFMEYYSFMQELADKYSDVLQFAFKPHPFLIRELYRNENWGKEKTDAYYSWWQLHDNTQLETGGFIDLFKSSDALIHDSASFSVEYFYTGKPALYLCKNLSAIKQLKNRIGKEALDTHYIGENKKDILNFIDDVIIQGIDPMKSKRNSFFNTFLLPPNGKTVAQNTMDDILESLNIQ